MKNPKRNAFTLIELMVVVVLVAILASIVTVSYVQAQIKSRDNKRKTDVQAIASAYQVHYQETKTWTFSTPELQTVVPGTPATHEGSQSSGSGFFNYTNGTTYLISMAQALSGLGYLNPAPRDPQIPNDSTTTLTTGARQYMKYAISPTIISVYTKLEIPNDAEIAEARLGYNGVTLVDTPAYGMTYAVTLKGN